MSTALEGISARLTLRDFLPGAPMPMEVLQEKEVLILRPEIVLLPLLDPYLNDILLLLLQLYLDLVFSLKSLDNLRQFRDEI